MPIIQHCSADYDPASKERAPSWELLGPESEQRLREDIHNKAHSLWPPPTAGDNLTFEGGWEERRDQPSALPHLLLAMFL